MFAPDESNVRLEIYGDGDAVAEVRALAESLGIGDRVLVTGEQIALARRAREGLPERPSVSCRTGRHVSTSSRSPRSCSSTSFWVSLPSRPICRPSRLTSGRTRSSTSRPERRIPRRRVARCGARSQRRGEESGRGAASLRQGIRLVGQLAGIRCNAGAPARASLHLAPNKRRRPAWRLLLLRRARADPTHSISTARTRTA